MKNSRSEEIADKAVKIWTSILVTACVGAAFGVVGGIIGALWMAKLTKDSWND